MLSQGVGCDELTGWLAVVMLADCYGLLSKVPVWMVSNEKKPVGCLTRCGVVLAWV